MELNAGSTDHFPISEKRAMVGDDVAGPDIRESVKSSREWSFRSVKQTNAIILDEGIKVSIRVKISLEPLVAWDISMPQHGAELMLFSCRHVWF